MRMFRQAMVGLAAAALLAGPAAAQQAEGGRAPEFGARNPVGALLAQREALGLTADQVRQLEVIQARVERENALRIERIRAAMTEARALLSAEQQAKLPDLTRRGQGRTAPLPGGMAARVLERREALGLTADQVSRLEAVRERVRQENEDRIERLRTAGAERAELVRAIRASHRESLAAVREILTDEQEAKLRDLAPVRERRPRR